MSKPAAYRIAPSIWRIPAARFDFVNIYALVDDDGQVTLVDTGFKSGAERAEAGLAAMGKALGDVTRIVLTHAHSDHAGSAARLSELTGAGVAISKIDARSRARESRQGATRAPSAGGCSRRCPSLARTTQR